MAQRQRSIRWVGRLPTKRQRRSDEQQIIRGSWGNRPPKYAPFTVAFNKPEELSRLLRSLPATSLSGLIVVDNSEYRYIKDNQSIFQQYSQGYTFARYIEVGRNIGSAGGFALGMKTAHSKRF